MSDQDEFGRIIFNCLEDLGLSRKDRIPEEHIPKNFGWAPDFLIRKGGQLVAIEIKKTIPVPDIFWSFFSEASFKNPNLLIYLAVPISNVNFLKLKCKQHGFGLISVDEKGKKIAVELQPLNQIARPRVRRCAKKLLKVKPKAPRLTIIFLSSKQSITERKQAKKIIPRVANTLGVPCQLICMEEIYLPNKRDLPARTLNEIKRSDILVALIVPSIRSTETEREIRYAFKGWIKNRNIIVLVKEQYSKKNPASQKFLKWLKGGPKYANYSSLGDLESKLINALRPVLIRRMRRE